MSDVNRVITLGVGPGSDIPGFVLTGLNVTSAVVFTGLTAFRVDSRRRIEALDVQSRLTGLEARRRIEALDAQARVGIYAVDTFIGWPDGQYVGFGDDTGIGWADLSGDNAGQVPNRLETLKVNRQ